LPAPAPSSAADDLSLVSGPPSGFAQTIPQGRPTLTEAIVARAEPALVAIYVAKVRHEVLFSTRGKMRRRRPTVPNQFDALNRLITLLTDYSRVVRTAFEATGNYHCTFAYRLGAAGFDVTLVSSIALARTHEALNNS